MTKKEAVKKVLVNYFACHNIDNGLREWTFKIWDYEIPANIERKEQVASVAVLMTATVVRKHTDGCNFLWVEYFKSLEEILEYWNKAEKILKGRKEARLYIPSFIWESFCYAEDSFYRDIERKEFIRITKIQR